MFPYASGSAAKQSNLVEEFDGRSGADSSTARNTILHRGINGPRTNTGICNPANFLDVFF